MIKNISHIIPASGLATRLSGIPKFLLPIPNMNNLITFHVSLSENNNSFKNINIATNSSFYEILNNLENLNSNQKLKAIEILNTKTMNETLNNFKNKNSEYFLLTMPDTFFTDNEIVKKMINEIEADPSLDCVLGLWNIKDSQRIKVGQCKIEDNRVVEVVDKNLKYKYNHLWGTVLFKKNLWEFIDSNDPHIGYSFNPAIQSGLKIGYAIASGSYYDCGTIEEYWDMVRNVILE
tara:strand:- start:982 stop:1686 length:705 start_codon:yes stop_codon:yes gene_type:complete